MSYNDIEWEYKGFKCLIEHDVEIDNVKAFHQITTPDGAVHMLDISPYDSSKKTVEETIDYCIENEIFEAVKPSKEELKHYES